MTIFLRAREWALQRKLQYLSYRLDEIKADYDRDIGEGRQKYKDTIMRLRKVRRNIALQASPEVLLKEAIRE